MSEATVTYAEHEMLMLDFQAADKDRRRLARKVIALEQEQAVTEDSPEAANVIGLLELWWKEVKDSSPRVAHGLESTRAPKVRAALRRRKKVDGGDEEAFDVCRRAILGVLHDDWAMGRINKTQGKSFNDIAEHILNTDGDIEKFAGLYDKHNKPALEVVPDPEDTRPMWAREAPSRGLVRYVYGDDCLLEPQPETVEDTARREARETVERNRRDERLRVFGDSLDPVTRVLQALGGAEPHGDHRWTARCPAHDGDNPRSLQVTRGDTGCVLLKCWTRGCDFAEIADALGLDVRDLWDRSEFDEDARDYRRPEPNRVVAPHLRYAMQQMLGSERRAA